LHWRKLKMFNKQKQTPVVLVVDDDIFMRGMLQNLLAQQGYGVVEAEDGLQALAACRHHQPDLILMDAAMPVMDGFTACIELKKREQSKDVPIIMVTSLDDEESVDRAFEVGAVEYITKPIHWAVLRHRVNVILQAQWTEQALKQSEARFRGIFEQAATGIALTDIEGNLIYSNTALQTMLGHSEIELQQKVFSKIFYPFDTVIEKEFKQQLLANERKSYQMEKYFFRTDSPMMWGRITTSVIHDEQDEIQFIINMVEDITERKRAEAKQRLATKVFETTSDGIVIANAEGNIIDVNHAFLLMTDYSYEEILDRNPSFLKSGQHDSVYYEEMWTKVRETGHWSGEIWNKRKDGEVYSNWLSLSVVRGEHNEITHYVGVYSDISRLKADDTQMRLLTHYDALTDLPNRLLFHEYLTRACRQEQNLALLHLDLNDFKRINEDFGFDIGDECLKIVGQQLKKAIREGDRVARIGDDEFGIILAPLHQDYDARLVADRIFENLAKPMEIEGHKVTINCNIGMSFYPATIEAEDVIEVLIQHADMAMYLAKETGVNTYYIYQEDN